MVGAAIRAARPPAALAAEPRQPVRQHRDRGGAAAARAHAQRRRARDDRRAGPGGARDGRARGGHHAAGPDGPPRDHAPRRSRPSRRGRPTSCPSCHGEESVEVDGIPSAAATRCGSRPREGGDPQDHIMRGRLATIEKILHDVDDRLYFAVTVDGDPGQELLRDTGATCTSSRGRWSRRERDPDRGHRQLVAARRRLRAEGGRARWRSTSCPRAWPCSTSAAAGWTSPTR